VFETGGGFDYAQYSEPAVDKEIDKIQRMPIEDQPAAWGALEKKIMEEDYPVIVTGYGSVALLKGEAIQNFEIDSVFGTPTWKDLWIKQ
jgi:peptide/nickel transport system substrate-binding protein